MSKCFYLVALDLNLSIQTWLCKSLNEMLIVCFRPLHHRHVPQVPPRALCVRVLPQATQQGHVQRAKRQTILPLLFWKAFRVGLKFSKPVDAASCTILCFFLNLLFIILWFFYLFLMIYVYIPKSCLSSRLLLLFSKLPPQGFCNPGHARSTKICLNFDRWFSLKSVSLLSALFGTLLIRLILHNYNQLL